MQNEKQILSFKCTISSRKIHHFLFVPKTTSIKMAKTLETRSECTNATEHMLNMFEIHSTNRNAFFSCSHWPGYSFEKI